MEVSASIKMEGPLSKWTNVMQGWQYRWFVLDDKNGILIYYTSKEKMFKGQRRGCVRLKGAVIGVDDEDESTFTITVDQKMFHFQARDCDERERWVRALESAIHKHSVIYRPRHRHKHGPLSKYKVVDGQPRGHSCTDWEEFHKQVREADEYLQIVLKHKDDLNQRCSSTSGSNISERDRQTMLSFVESAHSFTETAKELIVKLQLAKGRLFDLQEDTASRSASVFDSSSSSARYSSGSGNSCLVSPPLDANAIRGSAPNLNQNHTDDRATRGSLGNDSENEALSQVYVPEISYSSSDDENDYFDTVEEYTRSVSNDAIIQGVASRPGKDGDSKLARSPGGGGDQPDFGYDNGTDLDALYDEQDEDELENVQEHGSVIMHLLSQVSVGMDLTKVVLPTFILERRSLLEMYADFIAHPDILTKVTMLQSPEERMLQVLKWYLSAFHAGRKSAVAKKPYNPILGETFRCSWSVDPSSYKDHRRSNPPGGPTADYPSERVTFISEQVSHHPPVSAMYAEHVASGIEFHGHIWTKSKFLGLSIAVHNIGQGCLTLLGFDNEQYVITFPSGYGRSILTTPWIELGGTTSITCAKTGYSAEIEFLTKPFYGGKVNCIKASVYRPDSKTSFYTVKGQWNGLMTGKHANCSDESVFLDVGRLTISRKVVRPVAEQSERESRKLWRNVTAALATRDVHTATRAKQWLEQRQRDETKERQAKNDKWVQHYFRDVGDNWHFNWGLHRRLTEHSKKSSSST